MDSWLRPVFTRRHTTEYSTSVSADDKNEGEEGMSKFSRISSRIGFWSSTPSVAVPAPPNIRVPNSVYHKPSPDEMVEMLKVVMMNQSSMDTVPVQYNSCILHVLEAYYDMRLRLQLKQEEIESLKKLHAKDIDEFEAMAAEWRLKEKEYQTEVKRLEVLLANTERGTESVSIARSHSLVHGSKTAADTISKGIGTIKARKVADCHLDTNTASFTSQRTQQDSQVAQVPQVTPVPRVVQFHPLFRSRRQRGPVTAAPLQIFAGTIDQTPRTTPLAESPSQIIHSSEETSQKHTSENWSVAQSSFEMRPGFPEQRRHAGSESRVSRGLTIRPNVDPSYISTKEHLATNTVQRFGVGPDKSLCYIPVRTAGRSKGLTTDMPSSMENVTDMGFPSADPAVTRQKRFSFRPGDDASILSPRTVADQTVRLVFDEDPNQTSSNDATVRSSPASYSPAYDSDSTAKTLSNSKGESSSRGQSSHIPKEFRDYESLSRGNSTSSVITVVRDGPGRSSVDSISNNKQAGRSKLDWGVSSSISDAVAAAARALTSSSKNLSGLTEIDSRSKEESDVDVEAQGS